MASIKNIKVGQVLWAVSRQRAGNTMMMRTVAHPVLIKSIDEDLRGYRYSHNGNPERWAPASRLAALKVNKPELRG